MRHFAPFLLLAAWPGVALANPVLGERVVVRQVPETTHVQVTLAYNMSEGGIIEEATRDGALLEGSWAAATGFATNMGSGVEEIPAYQYCDCNVALGSHTYAVTTGGKYGDTLTATIDVVEDYVLPDANNGEGGTTYAWDEPDPIELQGIDCVAHCGHASEPADAGTGPTSDGSEEQADATNANANSNAGCSVTSATLGGRYGVVVALAATILLLRKRRRASVAASRN